jgi:hypothetical protein
VSNAIAADRDSAGTSDDTATVGCSSWRLPQKEHTTRIGWPETARQGRRCRVSPECVVGMHQVQPARASKVRSWSTCTKSSGMTVRSSARFSGVRGR